MSKFKAPSNVKQFGNSDEKLKIYIEDYAYTYLQQYAKAGNYNERLAFLIGKNFKEDDKNIILISGAISVKHTRHDNGILNLTSESWDYVYEQIEKYFGDLEVVGLMQSQPGYGVYLNEKYVSEFRNNFNKLFQTFFLCDPIENLNVFHVFDKARENLLPVSGYFIYYQKNDAMNEYMIANKEIKPTITDDTHKEEPAEITIRKRQFERIKKSNNDQRKIVNMLSGLCAVLFLICFVMGTGLVQNEDRISKLEKQLKNLNVSYKKIEEKNEIASVFSEQSPKIVKDIEIETETPQKDLNTPQNTDLPTQNTIPKTYTVESGDSLSGISQKFFGNSKMVDKIMELNDMDDPDKIYVGKILKLPRGL